MGVDWVRVDAPYVRNAMSNDTAAYYDSWVRLRPDRLQRFDAIIEGVVAEFRTALLSNPRNVLDPDRAKLPLPCVRYAETLIVGALRKEMDRPLDEAEMAQQVRAEIMLRTFYTSAFLVSPAESAGLSTSGRPSYSTRDRHALPGSGYTWTRHTLPSAPAPAPEPVDEADAPTAFFYWADEPIVGAEAFAAWAEAVPLAYRSEDPVEGETVFSLVIVPPVANLVISYPAAIRALHSAVQHSTGVESRSGWINGTYSTEVTFKGRAYRLYQWMPGFPWEHEDSFRIAL